MNKELIQAQDVFLDKINRICGKFGLNNIMAQLYAILYLSSRALSLDDMVERLKISKGSVSTNIRALERYGAVRKVWIKGSRKDYYEAEVDIAKVIMGRIKSMGRNRLSEVDDMVNSSLLIINSVSSANKDEKQDIEIFRQRMDSLRKLHSKAQTLFKLFDSELLNTILKTKTKRENRKEALIVE